VADFYSLGVLLLIWLFVQHWQIFGENLGKVDDGAYGR
jgi:hypothetical protein